MPIPTAARLAVSLRRPVRPGTDRCTRARNQRCAMAGYRPGEQLIGKSWYRANMWGAAARESRAEEVKCGYSPFTPVH